MGRGEAAVDADAFVFLLFALDVAERVELGDDVVARVWDEEFGGAELVGDLFDAAVLEAVEVFAGEGADEEGVGHELAGALAEGVGRGVVFVEDGDDRLVGGAEFAEHAEGGGVVFFEVGVGDVDHVYQEIGYDDFLERGLERIDETVREAADETDGVGDEEFLISAQEELARGGVERGEEFVFGEDVGAGEFVEQRGFASVGVADDGGSWDRDALAFVALDAALFLDGYELVFELCDAVADETAILFELGFAFAAHAAAAAALTGQVRPGAGEPRKRILHAGESDLENGFAGAGAVGEDIEDDFFAVDDGDAGEFFPVALLSGREGFVDDDEISAELFGLGDHLLGLAAAEKGGGRGDAEVDEFAADDADVKIFDELVKFFEELGGLTGLHVVGLDAEEEGAFAAFGVVGGRSRIEEVGH